MIALLLDGACIAAAIPWVDSWLIIFVLFGLIAWAPAGYAIPPARRGRPSCSPRARSSAPCCFSDYCACWRRAGHVKRQGKTPFQ